MENKNKIKITKRHKSRNYFLAFLLIANSGLPFFSGPKYLLIFSGITLFFVMNNLKLIENKFFIKTLLFLTALVIGQTFTTKIFQINTTISLYLRWIYPFLVIYIVKDDFPKIFVNIIYFLTIVSFIFFIPSMIFPNVEKYLLSISEIFYQQPSGDFYTYNSNILLYTIKPQYAIEGVAIFKRNSGAFGEPGDFGVYLILALLFLLIYEKKIFTKKSTWLFLGIISTWSTATLLALSAILFFYGTLIIKQKNYRLMLVSVVILALYYSYTELPFFSSRIDRSIGYYENRDTAYNEKRDRMISAIIDLKSFSDHPIFGTGRAMEARFGTSDFTWRIHRNNGLTDFLAKYGIFFSLFYLYNIWLGYKFFSTDKIKKDKTYANIAIIAIMILGFSQPIFQKSTLIALFYLHTIYKHKKVPMNIKK